MPGGAATVATTDVLYTTAQTATMRITYGINTLDNPDKNTQEFKLETWNQSSIGFSINFTNVAPTNVRKIFVSVLAHPNTLTWLLALNTLVFPAADCTCTITQYLPPLSAQDN